MNIGEKIKERRLQLGIRQDTFADKLGVNKSTVSLWESGTNNPSTKRLEKIAVLLSCSVDYLTDIESKDNIADKVISTMNKLGLLDEDIKIEDLEKAFKIYKMMKE